MKRKLDENDIPEPISQSKEMASANPESSPEATTFAQLGLDPRLLQACARENFHKPTLIQSKAIPLVLEHGSDILAKSKTGSGKTAAYLLPILEAILRRKKTSTDTYTAALILVPTRELADQLSKSIETLSSFCAKEIQAVKLSDKLSDAVQRSLLSSSPDIVVATPARAWNSIKNSALSIEKLSHLVLDEADMLLSYGYKEDLQNVATSLPKGLQTILMSATLTTDVDSVKGLFCRKPTLLDLEEPDAEGEGITQYVVKCGEDEKFLLIYVIFKLKLIKGKCIVFVADVDRCYRLKLYFEQFGIRSCVLNAETPLQTRIHVVEQFNANIYDIIIASDDNEILGNEDDRGDANDEDTPGKGDGAKAKAKAAPKKKQKPSRRDKEYGISRGLDFRNVAAVINFDFPTTSKSYTHRIGRTARAGQTGTALSFVIPKEQYRKHIPTSIESAENDEKVLSRVMKQQEKKGKEVHDWKFDMQQVEAFRYRMNDALRAVTRPAIRESRIRELRQELLKSEKLSRHFAENPTHAQFLRHDGELRAARTQGHLKHVPEYLLPAEGKKALTSNDIGFVPLKKIRDGKGRKGRIYKRGGKKTGRRGADPLKSFKARSKTK